MGENASIITAIEQTITLIERGSINGKLISALLSECSTALSSRSAEAGKPVVKGLDDSALVKLMYKHLPPNVADDLTIDKHPPMFPQAEYSVPTLSARNFVDAIRAAAPQPNPSKVDVGVERLRKALEPFSKAAGELFVRNWNASQVAMSFSTEDDIVSLTAGDFFAARAALTTERQP